MRDRLGLLLGTLLAVSFISLALVRLGGETNNGAPVRSSSRDIGRGTSPLCAGETGNGAPVIVALREQGAGPRPGAEIGPGAPLQGTEIGNA